MIAMMRLAITQITMITCIQIQRRFKASRLLGHRALSAGGDHGRDR
jgi:hypothetical protein